jgi:CrcB protein
LKKFTRSLGLTRLLFITAGAIPGTFCRYLISQDLPNNVHFLFLATLVINISGSLLLGFLFILFTNSAASPNLSLLASVGFLGSFTTFSSFVLQVDQALKGSHYTNAFLYLLISVIGSLLATFLGVTLARSIIKR